MLKRDEKERENTNEQKRTKGEEMMVDEMINEYHGRGIDIPRDKDIHNE